MNIYAKSICKERVKMLKQCFDNVREKHPLVHNITNYVTVNDVANILLACGGSPIMADDSGEVEDITSICQGLNINIGTLNKNTIPSMFLAGKKANVLGHVVLLDPVGAGASGLRTKTANELVRDIKFTVIRGNISEIRTLMEGTGNTKGVDADLADAVTEEKMCIRDSCRTFFRAFPYLYFWNTGAGKSLHSFCGFYDKKYVKTSGSCGASL